MLFWILFKYLNPLSFKTGVFDKNYLYLLFLVSAVFVNIFETKNLKGFVGGIHKGGVLKFGIWENFMIDWNSQYSGKFSIFLYKIWKLLWKFHKLYENFTKKKKRKIH